MDPYLSMIILWPGQWIPAGWLACNGQLLQVNTYTALFSLIGNIYGGDGRVNFALPNLNGRVPVGPGQLAGTTSVYQLAQVGGVEGVTLTPLQMPIHNHQAAVNVTQAGVATGTLPAVNASASLAVSAQAGTTNTPSATNVPASVPGIQVNATTTRPVNAYGTADTVTKWNVPVTAGYNGSSALNLPVTGTQASVTIGNAGGSQVHENRQPFLVMNYIIAVEGIYPPRP